MVASYACVVSAVGAKLMLRVALMVPMLGVVFIACSEKRLAAMTLQHLTFEEVVHESARIVQATVVGVRSGRDEWNLPATWITLNVMRTLKGQQVSQLTIKQFGMVTASSPNRPLAMMTGVSGYRVGEEIVLFLRGESRRGFTSPVGFAQGTYRIAHAADGPRVRDRVKPGDTRKLDDFFAEVSRSLASGR